MNSLERSLQAGLLGTLVILLFVFWWAVTLTSRTLAESYVFNELARTVIDANSLIEADADNLQLGAMLGRLPSRTQLVLRSNGASSLWPPEQSRLPLSLPELVPGAVRRVSNSDQPDVQQVVHGWFAGFSIKGEAYVLGAIRDTTELHARLRVLQIFMAIAITVLIAAAILVQRFIVRRAVIKFDDIRRDMLRLERGHAVALSQEVPSEVLPLVIEFNRLLRRFEQRLRQSRNAVGNLAHSLKGPLNLLIRSGEAEPMGQAERDLVKSNTEVIRRLIESELKRARVAGRSAVGVRFDAEAELPSMIGLLEQVYADKEVQIQFSVDRNVDLLHDRQDMLELIGNLLDNAAKWCTSRVQLTMQGSDSVTIVVQDDGPGCSPEELGRLTDRGVRLDESVAGHGLGLSIVNDIVDTYEGRISLSPSEDLGGLKATVYLPSRETQQHE